MYSMSTLYFTPKYDIWIDKETDLKYPLNWRISSDRESTWVFNDRDCSFARKQDCQIACDTLNQYKLTEEQFLELSDEEFGELVTRNLKW